MTHPNAGPTCRCTHCYGNGVPTALTIVPAQSPAPVDAGDKLMAAARAVCPACQGDEQRCFSGTGVPPYSRLPDCVAYMDNGDLAPLMAVKRQAPKQPWEVRAA